MDEELARLGAEAPTAAEMERAQALLEREWLDRLGTVIGRANELCRYAMLFGDPQLAFTAVDRILSVTAEEVRAVAAARLRPDNRAVLAYEPVTPGDQAAGAAGGQAARPAGRPAGRSRAVTDTAVTMDFYPQPGRRAGEALGVPRARARHPGQRADRPALPPARAAGGGGRDLPGHAARRRARRAGRHRRDHGSGLSQGTATHTAEEFAAELERCGATLDAHADYLGARVSLEVPASRLPRALGLLAEALQDAHVPGQRDRAAGAQPARWDPDRAGQPRPARGQAAGAGAVPGVRAAVPAAQGHRGHRRPDRRGRACARSTRPMCSPPPRPRWWRAT